MLLTRMKVFVFFESDDNASHTGCQELTTVFTGKQLYVHCMETDII